MPGTQSRGTTALAVALVVAIVDLTLITAYVHLTLGGTLFMLNGLGYGALAAALVASTIPHPFVRRFAWVPRIALAGFTAATIVGYLVIGPYFTLCLITKAVEVAIIVLVAADLARLYGSPAGLLRAAVSSLRPGTRPAAA